MASDDRQKTIDEALCSLRSLIAGDETIHSGDKIDADEFHHALQRIAAEIDAAWKRERAEIKAQALSIGGIVESSRHTQKPQGNAAALREAVVALLDALDSLGCDESTATLAALVPDMADSSARCLAAFRKAKAALSAPARNCDAMPWRKAWDEWRAKHHPQNPQTFNESYEATVAFMEWFTSSSAEKGATA